MIWLVGAGGLLGRELRRQLVAANRPHVATGRDVDVRDPHAVRAAVARWRPRWIVNTAAFTAVDRAEAEPEAAHRLNAVAPGLLAEAAHDRKARLLHLGTDYVFDGRREAPYQEDDPPSPLGVYGRTKAEGEARVHAAGDEHLVVRTSWLHGPTGPCFVRTVLARLAGAEPVAVVEDQHGRPTYTADLAAALREVLDRDDVPGGTLHAAGEGVCTWYELARAVRDGALQRGLLPRAAPLTARATASGPGIAPRPPHAVLALDRLRATLGRSLPTWQDGLARHLDRLQGSDG